MALAVIVSQFCFHAYCISLSYPSSNSRRKKKKEKNKATLPADSITLQALSDRQPASELGLRWVQRAGLRT